MSTFEDREKGYESKFARDEETAFKINARRNKLLGLWAAEKLGKKGPDAEKYAIEVVTSDFERDGSDDVVEKLVKDLGGKASEKDIRAEMDRLLPVARKQILGEKH